MEWVTTSIEHGGSVKVTRADLFVLRKPMPLMSQRSPDSESSDEEQGFFILKWHVDQEGKLQLWWLDDKAIREAIRKGELKGKLPNVAPTSVEPKPKGPDSAVGKAVEPPDAESPQRKHVYLTDDPEVIVRWIEKHRNEPIFIPNDDKEKNQKPLRFRKLRN